jgi:hypothetical protein
MWNYNDPCNAVPTLYIDVFVDSFFLVRARHAEGLRGA